MLSSLIQHLSCGVCGSELIYNPKATFDIYHNELKTTLENINTIVDTLVGKFLVYECPKCKYIYKYTYKEIEKTIRYDLTKQVLLSLAGGSMKSTVNVMDGVLIYCGKCSGFDGSGSCTKKIYDACEVKRFPHVV